MIKRIGLRRHVMVLLGWQRVIVYGFLCGCSGASVKSREGVHASSPSADSVSSSVSASSVVPAHVSSNHFDRLFRRMGKLGGDLTWSMTSRAPNPGNSAECTPRPLLAANTVREGVLPKGIVGDGTVKTGASSRPATESLGHTPQLPAGLVPAPVTLAMRSALWCAARDVLSPLSVHESTESPRYLSTPWVTCPQNPQHRLCIHVWIDDRQDWDHALNVAVKRQEWIKGQWCLAPEPKDVAGDIKTAIMNHARSCWTPSAQP